MPFENGGIRFIPTPAKHKMQSQAGTCFLPLAGGICKVWYGAQSESYDKSLSIAIEERIEY